MALTSLAAAQSDVEVRGNSVQSVNCLAATGMVCAYCSEFHLQIGSVVQMALATLVVESCGTSLR